MNVIIEDDEELLAMCYGGIMLRNKVLCELQVIFLAVRYSALSHVRARHTSSSYIFSGHTPLFYTFQPLFRARWKGENNSKI